MTGTIDLHPPQCVQGNLFPIHALGLTLRVNDDLHRHDHHPSLTEGISGRIILRPGLIHQHAIQHRLHGGQLRGDLITQRGTIPDNMGICTLEGLLGRLNKPVKIAIGSYIEGLKPLEELGEVGDG
jgi:hypothetical protein